MLKLHTRDEVPTIDGLYLVVNLSGNLGFIGLYVYSNGKWSLYGSNVDIEDIDFRWIEI